MLPLPPCFLVPPLYYLDPQKVGHPPWGEPLWLQLLLGPPESVDLLMGVGVRGLTQCPQAAWQAHLGTKGFVLCTVHISQTSGLS